MADLLRAAPDLKVDRHEPGARCASRASRSTRSRACRSPPDPGHLSGVERMNLPGGSREHRRRRARASTRPSACSSSAPGGPPGFAVTNENAPAVAAISARLHGMPLAIELAAARVKLLSPGRDPRPARAPARRPGRRARATCPARQQTLRGAIAWSYDLLDDGGRRLLDRLSVFAGGCDLEAAEAVCGPASELGGRRPRRPVGARRPEPGPVDRDADGEPRFQMLETIREFAAELLEARGERELIRRPPSRLVRRRSPRRAAPELTGGEPADVARAPRARPRRHPGRARPRGRASPTPTVAIGLAFAMWRFWQKHGHLAEARRRLEAMAAAPWSHDDPRLRARLMEALGGICWWQGDITGDGAGYREALEIWRGSATSRELANAFYNLVASPFAVGRENGPIQADDPDRAGLSATSRGARRIYRRHRRRARRGQRPVGHRQLPLLPGHRVDGGVASSARRSRCSAKVGDRTMEAWALHMLGSALHPPAAGPAEARGRLAHASRHFHAAGRRRRATLILDDLSSLPSPIRRPAASRAAPGRGAQA